MTKTSPKTSGKTPRKSKALQLDAAAVEAIFAGKGFDTKPAALASEAPAEAPAAPAKPAVPAPEVMVAAVRDYAMQYYNDGWDFVVECWTDADIAKTIVGAKSEKGAIRKVWHVVKELIDYRKEVQAA